MTLSTLQINAEMMGAMKGVNDVMGKVNEEMNVQDIQKVIREFSKESEKFGMNQEMVSIYFDLRIYDRWLNPWIWHSIRLRPKVRLTAFTIKYARNRE